MPFDGITVRALAHELNPVVAGSRIEKISMPAHDDIILQLHGYGKSRKLRINMNPSNPGMYVVEDAPSNPPVPPNFCMFLRKHISSGMIEKVFSTDYERYISISIQSRNDLGDMQNKTLIVELTGRNSNVVLINASGKILDALRHVDESMSSVREIMPARPYSFLPPQDKAAPEDASAEAVLSNPGKPLDKALLHNIKGFSPVLCREVCNRAGIDPKKSTGSLSVEEKTAFAKSLEKMLSDICGNSYSPCVVKDASGNPSDFHALALTQYPKTTDFESLNAALLFYFTNTAGNSQLGSLKSGLLKTVSKNMERCKKKISIHAAVEDRSDEVEEYRLYGELINANLHSIRSNSPEVELLNYYTGENVTVSLDPNLDAAQNAQRYFKKYKKHKSAVENAAIQMEDAKNELEYLQSVEHALDISGTREEIDEIKSELVSQDYVKQKSKKRKKGGDQPGFNPVRYVSSEGYEIYAGRNNRENDRLTLKFANSRDLWLHVKSIPGSHVIVRKKDRKEDFFPDLTISEAAVVAAYHSKARNSGQTAVDYTLVRNVKKPANAKPGMVNYFEYHSAYATADEELIKKLKSD